jgi:hypothetical protein
MPESIPGQHARAAREALSDITPEDSIGEPLDERVEDDGTITVRFESLLAGYPGWHWSVSLAELPDEDPTVLEAELMPGEGALLAPDWLPWSERLEEYRAAQGAAGELDDTAGSDDEDELDEDELDEDDLEDDDLPDFDLDDLDSAAVAPVDVEEQDESDSESDEDGPEQPDPAAFDDDGEHDEQRSEGD